MNMNTVRQMERRVEASQETIIDQLQTIEKFRELVRHLQVMYVTPPIYVPLADSAYICTPG